MTNQENSAFADIPAKYLEEIAELREKIKRLTVVVVPGLIAFINQLATLPVQKAMHQPEASYIELLQEQSLLYAFLLCTWLIPLEIAEYYMSQMKQKLRGYRTITNQQTAPIEYRSWEIRLHRIMSWAHDRSELVADKNLKRVEHDKINFKNT